MGQVFLDWANQNSLWDGLLHESQTSASDLNFLNHKQGLRQAGVTQAITSAQ